MEKIVKNAWNVYKRNFATLVGGYVLSVLIPLVFVVLVGAISFFPLISVILTSGFSAGIEFLKSDILMNLIIPGSIVFIAMLVFFPPFTFGYFYLVTKCRKGKPKIGFLIDGVKKFWKRAILQQFIYSIIQLLVSLPLLIQMFRLLFYSGKVSSSVFFSFIFLFLFWIVLILVISLFLIFWAPSIVIYDIGVKEGLEKGIKKVLNNVLETFVLLLLIFMISVVSGVLEQVIPLIPILVLYPLIRCLVVEACIQLDEK